ncbi:winged helix-turn-helix transcriptional regulator [Clostridium saccharoperbutylacetonicum]|jgi:DNA-binding HxlR family transcriptional regulator|uniref:Transcriptional regulator, HxlR family n=1 Tax=Clostridium saccharoperbutylacetonicum N1-4(HMT) TaxID=931276 RepID=M1LTM1_9CLOT|nr:helix-turn-helix domain-containing protein [Clostridium saccharoperbutylacetonicum]AGF56375.1 transcriptional regulator, HxlR family [Clostridium saccharoperbutylacetonicum N1-4(HMT)]AQR95116.1 HTH-type transcriptional activator HxlR [Clostridium saccharoperbutylacetonicum]NRT62881.1 DNA-binding HxlR family transcriptional regulator [Clostridium saccharoperbutylacetonicum]NSB26237.1 DNA-binding HxlR family transcriptional regulator [Clostridium saccharoperbutylacetonicum]NSB30963.1 DNA-bind
MEKLCYVSNKEPFEYTLSIVSGKWKLKVIYLLACSGTLRYGELKKNIEGITHKMLSSQLKELENENIILRKEYPQIPPKVEYSLAQKGQSLIPIVRDMCKWGKENI